jgi:hypothetical protein
MEALSQGEAARKTSQGAGQVDHAIKACAV